MASFYELRYPQPEAWNIGTGPVPLSVNVPVWSPNYHDYWVRRSDTPDQFELRMFGADDLPNRVSIRRDKVANIYNSMTEIEPARWLPNRSGTRVSLSYTETQILEDTNHEDEQVRVVPFKCVVNVTVPTLWNVNSAAVMDFVRRAIGVFSGIQPDDSPIDAWFDVYVRHQGDLRPHGYLNSGE